jgi:hypothetical protein
MLATLAELLAPVSVPAFLESVRSRTRFHVKATNETRARALLPWHDIERLTSTPAVLAEATLIKDGMFVPAQLYASDGDLDVRAFHDILGQGASIVINEINRWVPGIDRLAVAVERTLGVDTGVNAYLSFSQGGAFRPHWDRHDALIVQVHGKKAWRFWDAPLTDPVQRSAEAKYVPTTPPALEVDLSPGDVFYVPRGQPHAAAVSGESSVHLTIGLNTLNGIDFLQYLRTAAESDEFLRADLSLATRTSDAALRPYEDELKRRLHRLIEDASVADFLRQDDVKRAPSRRTWLGSAPPQPGDLLCLTLRRRVPLPPSPATGSSPPVIIGGKQVTLTAAALAAIDWLFDHDRSSTAALTNALAPRYEPSVIDTAIRQLMHDGFLVKETENL